MGVCNLISIHFRFLFKEPHLAQLLNCKHLSLELETHGKLCCRSKGRTPDGGRGVGGALQGLGQKHRKAGLLRCFTSCLDMSGMTQGYSLHLGSKSEKNIPLARGTLCAHAFQTQNYSAAAAHLASGPAPCLQRAPTAGCLPGAWGGGAKKSCLWPQDVLFWPASFR